MNELKKSIEHVHNLRKIALTSAIVTIVGIFATVGFVSFRLLRHYVRCDERSEIPVWSPDGKWAVTSSTRACPAGPLSVTNYDVSVNLSARQASGAPVAAPVRVLEIDDAAEPPHIIWTNRNELKLELNEEGAVSLCKHEVAEIKIKYVVPKWMWNSLGAIEPDRIRDNRQDEELFKAGKMSRDDLRISLQIHQGVADERAAFRRWVLDNATVDGDAVTNGLPMKR